MRTLSRMALALVALALSACGSDSRHGNEPVQLPGTPVALTYVIPSGHPTGVEAFTDYIEPVRLVIRDEAAWADAWAKLMGSDWLAPVPPTPVIDFTTEMVVIAGIGRSGGRDSMVMPLAALQADGSLSVAVEEITLGSGCAWGPMETRQAAAAKVSRADAVTFVEFKPVKNCE